MVFFPSGAGRFAFNYAVTMLHVQPICQLRSGILVRVEGSSSCVYFCRRKSVLLSKARLRESLLVAYPSRLGLCADNECRLPSPPRASRVAFLRPGLLSTEKQGPTFSTGVFPAGNMPGAEVLAIVRLAPQLRANILHTRNQHLRNHRGSPVAFPNVLSAAFSNEIPRM